MVTATLRVGNTVKHVNLTNELAAELRDNAWRFHDRLNLLGVSIELHHVGFGELDTTAELLQLATDMADEAVDEARNRSALEP